MIRTLLHFSPRSGDVRRVEDVFAVSDVLAYSLRETRAISSELCVAVDGGEPSVVVAALWPDREAYQEWMDHPNRSGVAEGLPELVGEPGAARIYEVRQWAEKSESGVTSGVISG